jgi:alanyl-tRNA synthetase
MQQHTGQHLLSAAFDRLYSVRTVGFHLGAQASTIDLARGVSSEEIAAAEDLANQIVWGNRAVTVRFASAEEAAQLPLRKESSRTGTLRLIDIDRFDLSACGGTHVTRAGEVGLIAVSGDERVKGGQRLEFLCGRRALGRFRDLRHVVDAGVRRLSVQPADLAGAIERLQADARAQKKAMAGLQGELAVHRAAALVASAEPFDRGRLILQAVDADAGGLKALASAAATEPGHLAVLTSVGRPALVVVARSADLAVDASRILAGLIARFGGRGGGKPDLAQGGGLDASSSAVFAEARRLIADGPSRVP